MSGSYGLVVTDGNSCSSATSSTSISVTAPPNAGSLSGSNSSIGVSQTVQLTTSGSAGGNWGSNDASIASVNSSGLVTGVSVGSTNITYTVAGSGGCSDDVASYSISILGSVSSGNWSNTSIWSGGIKPTAGQNITILHDITIDESTADLGNLTINSGTNLSVGAFTLEVSGTLDNNGTISITNSSSIVDVNGDYNATGGNTTFSAAGRLELAGTVTSLGTFTPSTGKVIYNGGAQNVLAENYSNLTLRGSGVKTASGNINVTNELVIRNGTTFDIAATTTTVTGTTYVNSSGTLSISTGTFDANGTFNASGTPVGDITFTGAGSLELGSTVTSLGNYTGSNSTILFNGSSAQTINAGSGFTVDNLTVNNASGVTLNTDVTVNSALTLTSGDITSTSTNKLSLKSSVSGGSSSSHISGPVDFIADATNECSIPVGNGTDYTPIKLQRSGGSATTYTAEYTTGTAAGASLDWNSYSLGLPHSGSNISSVNHAYYVDIAQASGSADAHVSLYFGDFTTVPSATDQYVVHWDGSKWEEMTTVSRSGNYVKVLATSFSPFGQGSGGAALPIDLVSFTGKCENNTVELEFVVASQINNDYYTIERSVDGNEWSEIGLIEGEGNTSTQITYKWIDGNPTNGVNYYRLSQTDYDGTSETFAPIAITCETAPVDGYSVYPNPANGLLNIDLELENHQGDDVWIEVIDINGKILQIQQVQLTRGYNHLEVDLSEIPSGVYMINFAGTKYYIKQSRIIKH